jgi:hypothetical protein
MQREKMDRLEDALGMNRGTLVVAGESQGYVFTRVRGITVLIAQKSYGSRGGYKIAAVRTYPERIDPSSLDAVLIAEEIFTKQRRVNRKYGHLGPIVSSKDWRCSDKECACQEEAAYDRRVARGVGYQISVIMN